MSSSPVTTPAIDRANRLMAIRSQAGFQDILQISKDLVDEAVKICMHYPGWDPLQITVLKVRMQVAQEHHETLLGKINEAIQQGIAEMREQVSTATPEEVASDAIDQGDHVRQRVMEYSAKMENRIPGSF